MLGLPPMLKRVLQRKQLKMKGTQILFEAFGDPAGTEESLRDNQLRALKLVRALCDDLPTELVQKYLNRRF